MARVHPTAIVHSTARLAGTAEVGAYCIIGPEVTIGADTVLHSHVCVQGLTDIGERNVVYPFSVIGADPQDRKWNGEPTTCVIGSGNRIREHVTIHRGTPGGGGVTRIGDNNLLMVACHIAHDCVVGNDIVIANQVMAAGHARIEDGANIGGGAGLHHFVTVGTCAFVGGLARITKDVPPFMIVEGNPAEVRAINTIAMSRRGYAPDEIEAIKEAYRRLFRENGAAMAEKLAILREEFQDRPAVQVLCRAMEATSVGIHGRALELMRTDNKRASIARATSAAPIVAIEPVSDPACMSRPGVPAP